MKSAKHKVKDGKTHKKARVARFITGNFYFLYANKIMNFPYNAQPIPQPISHRNNILKQQYNTNEEEIHPQQVVQKVDYIPHSNISSPTNNQEQIHNNVEDSSLEVETINLTYPSCVYDVIPKSFDIVKRGSLPSIVFHNNKINIIE